MHRKASNLLINSPITYRSSVAHNTADEKKLAWGGDALNIEIGGVGGEFR